MNSNVEKLFVYGTLAPGRPNEHILKKIAGSWKKAYVWGKLLEQGWGAAMGFPGIKLDEKSERVEGYVFYSANLQSHWNELDNFEGEAYQRIRTTIILEDENEPIKAFIYALK